MNAFQDDAFQKSPVAFQEGVTASPLDDDMVGGGPHQRKRQRSNMESIVAAIVMAINQADD
jgi:hypothetical protein